MRADPQRLPPRCAAVFQPGHLRRGRCDAHAHRGGRILRDFILCFQPTRPTSVGRIDIASADFRQRAAASRRTTCRPRRIVADVVHGGRLLQSDRAHAGDPARLIREPIAPDLASDGDRTIWSPIFARAQPRCITPSAPAAWAKPRAIGGRRRLAGARHRALARGGRIGVSDGDLGQHQCADSHGGAESRGSNLDRLIPRKG